jgi:catechol 2,3-dioxygenase-like lactoylglutathione lyase family enzyme
MSLPITALKAHVALNVKGVNASVDFYRKLFGVEPSKQRTGYAKFDVRNPPLNLSLNESVTSNKGALSHMGIQVSSTEDVLAVRQQWAEAGLLTRDEMQTNCCYAVQDKTWVADPDGNEWEAFAVLKDNLQESSACCGSSRRTTRSSRSVCEGNEPKTSQVCFACTDAPCFNFN